MNRHHDSLIPALRVVATQMDIADLCDVHTARITDAELVAAVTPEDFPGLDPERVSFETITITPTSRGVRAPRVRIYRPRGVRGPLGTLIFAHGGAFCLGDLETDHLRCMLYAQEADSIVVSVEYALAPESPYPAGLHDTVAALQWIAAEADGLGVDSRRIAIGGESAGGCLAAAAALHCRDTGVVALRGQMLLFPALDHRQQSVSMRDGADMPAWNSVQSRLMWEHYLGGAGAVSAYAAPALADDLRDLPAALVVTAQVDPLRDEALAYAGRLCEASVPTEIHNYPGTFHVFDAAAPALPVAQRAFAEQTAFLGSVLGV
ncbi:alpha/beta hydrolase [Mycolicibacterium sp. 120266]|uniref:alpha/beta hydrolase n=1 Tax=Mycolicibacterium sp. 120266 TaxID=3090601 RepID=UPI00299CFCB4|nr:alpha/beta hydrolase [Mycolicibacterium sp. 120266]MDX1876150.1 alpha/beta hydrolase [Mycolicibacterium sp. 120266]